MKEVKVEGLSEYNELSERLEMLDVKMGIVWEDKEALEKDHARMREEETALIERRYDCGEKVVAKHQFWADKEMRSVAKIIRVPNARLSLAYIVSVPGEEDHEYHTSSVGFLMRFPIPITEEHYNDIYNKFKNN